MTAQTVPSLPFMSTPQSYRYSDDHGNRFTMEVLTGGCRHYYDFGPCRETLGWETLGTEADEQRFGIWVHVHDRIVVIFDRGIETLVFCASGKHLNAEIERLKAAFGPPRPSGDPSLPMARS